MRSVKGPNGLVVEVPEHVASGLVASGLVTYAEPARTPDAKQAPAQKTTHRKTS